MPALLHDLSAWRHLTPPVQIGEVTADAITLDELSTPRGYQRVTASMSGPGIPRRSTQLSPLHLANWTIIELLVRPCCYDEVWITARPHQLGFLLGTAGDIPGHWLAPDVGVTTCPDPSAAGTALGALLAPVADVVARCSRIHPRAVATIAAESAIGHLFGTARSAGHLDDEDWLETAAAALALALGTQATTKRLRCHPDAGPAVVTPGPEPVLRPARQGRVPRLPRLPEDRRPRRAGAHLHRVARRAGRQ